MNINSKQIVFVHFSTYPGGIEVLLPEIIKGMPQYSFSSFVIRPPEKEQPDVFGDTNIKLEYGSKRTLNAVVKLFFHSRRNRNCIFHVFNIGPLFLLTLRLAGIRHLVYSVHGTKYWKSRRQKILLKVLWHLAMHKKYIVTSNSAFSRSVFKDEVLPVDNITVLYNPIDNKRFTPPQTILKNSPPLKIIYCGRLDKGKNLDVWINVAVKIRSYYSDTVFEIYGDGSEYNHVKQLITEYGADSYISLKGYIQDTKTAYHEADLMIFLSQYESFGNVVVESILCGTPVLAGNIPSMREIFADFPEFLVDLNEETGENIVRKIERFDVLVKATDKAREAFVTRFSPGSHFEKLGEVYKRASE